MTEKMEKLEEALRLYEESRLLAAKGKAIIEELGRYDGGVHGAAGEIYAEEYLGMDKAVASLADVDGWIDGVPVQVKTKTVDSTNFRSRYVELHRKTGAELLVVILINGSNPIHFGTFRIGELKGKPVTDKGHPTGKIRYLLREMAELPQLQEVG